jgi:hypothetical protein
MYLAFLRRPIFVALVTFAVVGCQAEARRYEDLYADSPALLRDFL